MNTIGVVVTMLAALLIGCQQPTALDVPDGPTVRHPNGLVVVRPAGFHHLPTPAGFAFAESATVRTPRALEIEVVNDAPATRELQEQPLSAGRVARFSVYELGTGSAGADYEMRAATRIDGRWVALTAREQSERGAPAFTWAFRVLDSAGLTV